MMQRELIACIRERGLSPFSLEKKQGRAPSGIYKTPDAKAVHARVINVLSSSFAFRDTETLWQCFPLGVLQNDILERQKFFQSIPQETNNALFHGFAAPKPSWNPLYGVVVVTEDETMFVRLRELGCPVQFLIHEGDVASLEAYDLVQVVACEQFSRVLEQLPQSIFLDSVDEAYLERHVRTLSGWRQIIEALATAEALPELREKAKALMPLLALARTSSIKIFSHEEILQAISEMNDAVAEEVKSLTLSGEALLALLHKSSLPASLRASVRQVIIKTGLPERLFFEEFPVTLHEEEFSRYLKEQHASQHTALAEEIRKHAISLMKIPEKLRELGELLLVTDFMAGINKYLKTAPTYPFLGEQLSLLSSTNLLLENAQPISFHLSMDERCSILTGANSGGKTTLLEHLLQLVSLSRLGLSTRGEVTLPIFEEVYYFAKNKGSMNKGAFETLLTQLASVTPGRATLILADEIESVTEPGVAGLIICATAQYFLEKGCFLVIATHLGQEVQHRLPKGARIDGIEARGLTGTFELIVDHNPVLGRLAHSTPELIIEKLAKTREEEYFAHLYKALRNEK